MNKALRVNPKLQWRPEDVGDRGQDHRVSTQDTVGTESQPKWASGIRTVVDGLSPKPMYSDPGNGGDGFNVFPAGFGPPFGPAFPCYPFPCSRLLRCVCVPCAALGWMHTFVIPQGLESQETWTSVSKGSEVQRLMNSYWVCFAL